MVEVMLVWFVLGEADNGPDQKCSGCCWVQLHAAGFPPSPERACWINFKTPSEVALVSACYSRSVEFNSTSCKRFLHILIIV